MRLHLVDALAEGRSRLQGPQQGTGEAYQDRAESGKQPQVDRISSLLDNVESSDFALVQKPFPLAHRLP